MPDTHEIGGRIVESHTEGDVRVIDKFDLTEVSLRQPHDA